MTGTQLPPLVLRADGDARQGTGHLMRARALGMAWQARGGSVHLVTATSSPGLLEQMRDTAFTIHRLRSPHPDPRDAKRLLSILEALAEPWVVIDGYHFDEQYVARIQEAGHRVLHLDDMAHLPRYTADIVVNQNAHAGTLRYRTGPRTKLLAGTRYAILRPEFTQVRPPGRTPRRARRLLVTFGGADPHQLTEKAIEAISLLDRQSPLTVTVVVGRANPRWRRIARLAKADDRITLVRGVSNMAELMAAADLAVSSAGTTVWELAAMGVPALLVESGPAERMVVAGLEPIGLYGAIGPAGDIDARAIAAVTSVRLEDVRWRRHMRSLARRHVDAHGVDRIIAAMLKGAP